MKPVRWSSLEHLPRTESTAASGVYVVAVAAAVVAVAVVAVVAAVVVAAVKAVVVVVWQVRPSAALWP